MLERLSLPWRHARVFSRFVPRRRVPAAILIICFGGCTGTHPAGSVGAADIGVGQRTSESQYVLVESIDDAFLKAVAMPGSVRFGSEPVLPHPVSVTTGADGSLTVADQETGQILQLSSDRTIISSATVGGSKSLGSAGGLRVIRHDAGGNLYLCDADADHVTILDQQLGLAAALTPPYEALHLPAGRITGVALGAYGEVYLADQINRRIYRFDGSGRFIADIRGDEAGWSRLISPAGLACDATDGSLYVCDPAEGHVVVFDNSGVPRRSFGENDLSGPVAVALDRLGRAYVADSKAHAVFIFASDGRLESRLSAQDDATIGLQGPTDLSVSDSTLYVADPPSGRVLKIRVRPRTP